MKRRYAMATLELPVEASFSTTEAAFLIMVPAGGGVAVHGDCDGINPESNLGGIGVRGTGRGAGTGVFGEGSIGMVAVGVDTGIVASGANLAGRFNGDVEVRGDIRLTNAADCAEDFTVMETESVEAGTVVVLGEEGAVRPSERAYDKRVAGVISGAGGYKPGIVLDKQPLANRQPVALMGKAYCKVDAQYGAIEVGDLLTTSSTPGHAMKADDPFKSFGAVIGKALRPLREGQGLIPILIALQ
jgi:hypothetical protein